MGRTKGAKDRFPRKRKVVSLNAFKETKNTHLKEGIDYIVNLALKNGLHVDLWEILNCFRRLKNL